MKIFSAYVNLWFLIFVDEKEIAMCCFNFGKFFFSFALMFALGLLTVNVLRNETSVNKAPQKSNSVEKIIQERGGNGVGYEKSKSSVEATANPKETAALKILSKPRANYTDLARQNNTQGSLVLRIVFLASGEIGSVSPVTELPNGLTEEAIAAAKQIKFEPMLVNGKATSITKNVQYNFTIY